MHDTPVARGTPRHTEEAAPAHPADTRGLGVRIVRAAGWTLIWLGLLTLGFVAHQLWVTTWFAERNQAQLDEARTEYFATAEVVEVPFEPPAAEPDAEPLTLLAESSPPLGEAFALIRIPNIEALREGWNVVHGVRLSDLRNGAGHMPDTPLPGQPGNAVISGHRTTYGAPFHDLDILVDGDRIEVDTAIGTHVYEVRESFVVKPTDIWVTDPLPGGWLTLTTCEPKYSARERLIIQAELVDGPNAEVILAGL
ncbi:MAG TPA: sortase [Acidimicrobiia bacterium]|nr:sortase [Acidimicrobiia bacterium]